LATDKSAQLGKHIRAFVQLTAAEEHLDGQAQAREARCGPSQLDQRHSPAALGEALVFDDTATPPNGTHTVCQFQRDLVPPH
jgi:hypothetical protein